MYGGRLQTYMKQTTTHFPVKTESGPIEKGCSFDSPMINLGETAIRKVSGQIMTLPLPQ